MEARLHTLFSRGRANEIRAVHDGRRPLGVLPPVWAIWNGLWLTLVVMLGLIALVWWLHPDMARAVWVALILLSVLEGGAIERLELRIRGWREVGVVEARSAEGAEELYLRGEAA